VSAAWPGFRQLSWQPGTGKPVIALGSDIDDIPQASQKPGIPWHEPMIEARRGTGKVTNSGMPLQIMRRWQ